MSARFSPVQLAHILGLPEPTAEQAAVIAAPPRPLAVIAGAGSGKSETMAARVVWLAANGLVRPDRMLGLTFTRKATAEFAGRVRARLERLHRSGLMPVSPASAAEASAAEAPAGADPGGTAPPDDPVISTYHAYAGRLVADNALREGLEPGMRLITPAESWQLAARIVAAYDGPMDDITWSPRTVTAAVLALAGEMAEHLHDVADVAAVGEWLEEQRDAVGGRVPAAVRKICECQRAREQMLPLVAAYTREKAAREVLDHSDQVALAARIATRHPEVGAAERGRYAVVLLDEYQDTSHAQLVLLRALFGGGHPVTAVGDPCQSIYGWRGASAGNLRRFVLDFPGPAGPGAAAGPAAKSRRGAAGAQPAPAPPPAQLTMLSTSFRNAGRILDAAAAIQEDLRAEAPDVPRLVPAPGRAARGEVTCALLETAAEEAGWVAERIAGLLALPPGTAPDGGRWPGEGDGHPRSPERDETRVRPSDIAVLCRKRSQFAALRRAIEARGIPVEVVGLGGLLAVPEVADVVATLRVLHDAAASDALVRLLTGPRWRIGPRDLVALGRRARELADSGHDEAGHDEAGQGEAGQGEDHDETGQDTQQSTESAPGAGGQPPSGGRPAAGAGREGPGGRSRMGGGDQRVASDRAEGPSEEDALAGAITDLSADTGSLVEALDDLGDPAAYSAPGYARFRAFAAELRTLRGQASRPLPDLIGEVERTLGLDVEVAARPGADPLAARADLDALADAAAEFAGGREEPTLGAFLAYLAAAETEEFGLETGRVAETDTVKIATVHAAKGLEWAAVFVPGLSAGARAQVFPARPRASTRWTDNARLLPFSLRGDAADLPALRSLDADAITAFTQSCARRDLAEERRLMYVAATRAALRLDCSGYWWGDGAARLGPSPFLEEIRSACEVGVGHVARWAPPPAEDAVNPVLAEPPSASWPVTPVGEWHAAVREAAAMVKEAMQALSSAGHGPAVGEGPPTDPASGGPVPQPAAEGVPVTADQPAAEETGTEETGTEETGTEETGLDPADQALVAAWRRDAGLLLAERERRRAEGGLRVVLPSHLSVSSLVTLARDPAELASRIRRPMPQPPAPQARRGTAFHRWLEERYGQQRLIDDDDLFGADDDAAAMSPDGDLAELRACFEASEWAQRWPRAVEVPFETVIAGRIVRGRIDAVFGDRDDGGFDVVDWKTGQPPALAAERHAVAVQLAAYRLAWAALARVPVSAVRAAFYYVRHDVTVRPADLLDEAGLAALIEAVPAEE